MSISPRFLDEIRARISLSDVIGRKVSLTKAGREHKGCCPFHNEKTPSFTVNDQKQFYHCFGCGAHGDVIGFLMQHDNLSFIDAVESLASEAGLQMPAPDPQARAKAEKERGLHELMDEASNWMQAQLLGPKNADVKAYIESRGLDETICAEFRIGYAPSDGQALRKVLQQKGFSDAQMIEAGVLKQSDRGKEPYIFFRDRVMFPVSDSRGRVIAFGGRVLPEHIRPPRNTSFTPPKYINSSDTPLFDKGRILYAGALAGQAAHRGHTLIVTEGYMDVIACHKYGLKGAVAPMGTALTEEQIILLWKMAEDSNKAPILCFDGDNAGRRAASRAYERVLPLLKPGRTIRFAFLPEGEDPDTLLRSSGAKGLKTVLAGALSVFDFMWLTQTADRDFSTPEARAGLEQALHGQVNEIADGDVQKYYRQLIRDKISETFFARKKGVSGSSRAQNEKGPRLRAPLKRGSTLKERILLSALINNPSMYESVEEEVGRMEIRDMRLHQLRQKVIAVLDEQPELDFEHLQTHLKTSGFEQEMDDILSESVYVHAAFCRPDDSFDSRARHMQWLKIYQSLDDQGAHDERKQVWMQAFANADEAEEERIKDGIRAQSEG